MLYLHPPYHQVNGVSLFRDHEDPLQWYFLPLNPHLSTVPDPVTGTGVPQFQLLKFRGSAGTGGFLNFDVDLGISGEALDEIKQELKRLENLDDLPRLGPVPLADGSVRMMLFDAETPDPATPQGAPGDPPQDPLKFVLKLSHAAKPALYGDNRAAFSVQLTQEGVTTLEQAIKGELAPIGIVYQLDFLALRPAYTVRVEADWDRVQKHLEEHFVTRVPFVYQSEIDKIVDELIESQAIVIDVVTEIPEGEDASGVIDRRDQAVDEARDMITETFFTPSLDPMGREGGSGLQTAGRIIDLIVSGGASERVAFSYSKTDITRIDKRRLDVRMNERVTVLRSIYPQGHLSGLFRVLREPGVDLSRFVRSADLDDPWFERRRVKVISRADFARDNIASVNVTLDYDDEPQSVLLEPGAVSATTDWGSVLTDGKLRREVKAKYSVGFKDVDGSERPIRLDSPETVVTADVLEIDPRALYSIKPIPIIALSFPWDRYPHVEVQTEYDDPANGITQADSFLLQQGRTEATWNLFVRDPAKSTFRYKLIYRSVDLHDRETPWIETGDQRIKIVDPYPRQRVVDVTPAVNWATVDRIFVDLSYEDPANDVSVQGSFEFTQQAAQTRSFRVPLVDPDRRLVGYQITLILKNGEVRQIPPSATGGPRILVTADMAGHRIVAVRPENVSFAGRKVKELLVDVRYVDQAAGLSFADSYTFDAGTDQDTFEFDYVADGFEYRLRTRMTNGLVVEGEWTPYDGDELVLPVGP